MVMVHKGEFYNHTSFFSQERAYNTMLINRMLHLEGRTVYQQGYTFADYQKYFRVVTFYLVLDAKSFAKIVSQELSTSYTNLSSFLLCFYLTLHQF